ncbi:MAG: DNA primase [Gammaproteobacteria bacterium]|nr:DNA primase [Gammaproteobacteria bacterium]
MAGRIPQQFIDDLLNRVDIVEVIDSRVPLKKKGKEYTACCPFHSEKTPSFTVSQGKQFYHCFGCKANGSAIGFLMEYEHLSFPEAIEELARSQGVDVPYEGGQRPDPAIKKAQTDLYDLMQQTDQYFQQQLRQNTEAQTAISYLKERGLSGEIAKDFGIGFAPDGWDNLLKALGNTTEREKALVTAGMLIKKDNGKCYDRFRDRIMFPIRDRRGRCIAFGGRILPENKQVGAEAQGSASAAGGTSPGMGEGRTMQEQLSRKPEAAKYLNSPETPLFHKGRELYGLYEARQALRDIPRLMVVEGYMDVVALAQFDVRYAVATLGTATTADHLQRLFQLTSEIVFCFDGDRAGKDAAWRALQVCLPEMRDGRESRFMFLPDGEDPDSYIRKIGKEAFELEVKQSQTFSEYLFKQLTDEADISGIGGRAKLVETARPMLSQMPEGIYRKLMFEQLEKLGRVDLSLPKPESGRFKPSRKPGKKTATSMSPVRKAITLLLNQPSIAQHWLQSEASNSDELTKLDLPGMDLLLEVLEILRINPDLSTSALIERWRETPSGSHLAKLASEQPELDDSAALEVEFIAVMNALKKQSVDLRYDDLQAKLDHGTLNEAEMAEYKMLLQQIYVVKSASKPD